MTLSQPRIGLFATWLVDLFRPTVGFAAVKLLEDAGCVVEVPAQTCCGQPAYNSGDRATARSLAQQVIAAFEPFDYEMCIRDRLTLTRVDHNRAAEVRVGERIVVQLPENPTTGFSWAVDETDRRLLTLDGSTYVAPEMGFIGAKGQRTFQFTARQPGEMTLQLKYWRVWEGDGSVTERFTVTLRIVP